MDAIASRAPAATNSAWIAAASCSAAGSGRSVWASSSAAAFSGSPACFHVLTACRQTLSISSKADGWSPRAVTRATASPAAASVSKNPTTVRGVPVRSGRSRTVTSVITPRVPSEPTIRPARSYPATPFAVRRPTRTTSPAAVTTSSAST